MRFLTLFPTLRQVCLPGMLLLAASAGQACPVEVEPTLDSLAAGFECRQYSAVIVASQTMPINFPTIEFRVAALQRLQQFDQAKKYLVELESSVQMDDLARARLRQMTASIELSEERAGEDYWFQRVLKDPSDSRANEQLLQAQLRAENFSGAITTLNRLLINNPPTARVLKSLVDVSLQAGNLAQAVSGLNQLLDLPDLPVTLRDSSEKILAQLQRQQSPLRWRSGITLGVSASDNPEGSADDADRLGLTAQRSTGEMANVVRLNLGLDYRPPTPQAPIYSLDLRLGEQNYHQYDLGDNQTQSLSMGVRPTRGAWSASLTNARTRVNHQLDSETVSAAFSRQLVSSPVEQVTISLNGYKSWSEGSSDKSGGGQSLALQAQQQLGPVRLSAGASREWFDARDAVFSFDKNTINAGLSKDLGFARWSVNASLADKTYTGPDAIGALFSQSASSNRKDRETGASVVWVIPGAQNDMPDLTARISRQRVRSTLALYSKTSQTAELTWSWMFK